MDKLIDSQELDKKTKEYIKNEFGSSIYNQMYNTSKENWSENDKIRYRNARSSVYNKMRRELKLRSAKLWTTTFTAGNLEPWLKQHGIVTYNGGIYYNCRRLADKLVRQYITDILIPKMKEELNIEGVRMTNNTTSNCINCLDFSRAKVVSNEKVE